MKPKARVFTKKKRGTRKFIAENHNLIRNESQQAGLLEYDHGRMGYVMPKAVTPEMIEVAKAAQQRAKKGDHSPKVGYNILRGEQKPAKRGTDWAVFWAAIDLYDRTHGATVTAALKAWLDKNPSVKAMKNKPRLAALNVAADKMIAYLDKQSGRDSAKDMFEALDTEIKSPNLLPIYTKEANQCQNVAPAVKRIETKSKCSVVYVRRPLASSLLSIA